MRYCQNTKGNILNGPSITARLNIILRLSSVFYSIFNRFFKRYCTSSVDKSNKLFISFLKEILLFLFFCGVIDWYIFLRIMLTFILIGSQKNNQDSHNIVSISNADNLPNVIQSTSSNSFFQLLPSSTSYPYRTPQSLLSKIIIFFYVLSLVH